MLRAILRNAAVFALCAGLAPAAGAAETGAAIIIRDRAPLHAAPRASAQQQALLWQGEMVEVRAARKDYFQIYDYRRERGGFVHASHVRRVMLTAEEAPELLAIVRFVRDTPGMEALGIGFAAAYIQAATAEMLRSEPGMEALDALGIFSDRLAHRASSGGARTRAAEAALAAHLDVAARYGVKFHGHEYKGRMQICYEGDASLRLLALRASAEQRARAVLSLTRHECVNPDLGPVERSQRDEWRAEVLDEVDPSVLPPYLMNRVRMRRASVWGSLAYQRARKGQAAGEAAARALAEIAGVDKAELADGDLPAYNDAAMRVSASRWAASSAPAAPTGRRPHIIIVPARPGETCISLVDAKNNADKPLARRCTYGIVWAGSASFNREGTAMALAVQTMDAWREVWLFHKVADAWSIRVLPPAATIPEIGYAEFAGWVPGGRQVLIAREARGEGKYQRSFEVVRLDSLVVARQAGDPAGLDAFRRWQDPSWKRQTLSLR